MLGPARGRGPAGGSAVALPPRGTCRWPPAQSHAVGARAALTSMDVGRVADGGLGSAHSWRAVLTGGGVVAGPRVVVPGRANRTRPRR